MPEGVALADQVRILRKEFFSRRFVKFQETRKLNNLL